jgi:hypothetical protein
MKYLFTLVVIIFTLNSCEKKESSNNRLTDYIPNNPSIIISAPSINKLQNDLTNNELISSFKPTKTFKNLKNDFNFLNDIESKNSILISYANVGKTLEFLFATKTKGTTNNISTLNTKKSYNTVSYNKLKNQKAYSLVIDSTLVVSSSEILIENLIRFNSDGITFNDKQFFKIYKTKDNSKISAFINNEKKTAVFESMFPSEYIGNNEWSSLEFNNDNGLSINGLTTNTIIKHNFALKLLTTKTEKRSSSKVIPLNFSEITTYTFEELNNFNSLSENFNLLINNTTEVTSIKEGKNTICVFKLTDNNINKNLTEFTNYRNTLIYKNNYFKIPSVISKSEPSFACYLGDFLIFSDRVENLENCISHYQNKTTLDYQYFFEENNKALLDEVHITDIIKTSVLKNKLATILDDTSIHEVSLTDFPVLMNQITFEDNYIHFNSVAKKINKQKKKAAISQVSNIKFPSEINGLTQWVVNHKTNEKELVVQDKNNILYLISNKGNILWKKQLNEKIQGNIIQVDLFKNRKLQLAFTTKNEFLVLDRNGKIVDEFYKKFSKRNVLPLSVFDYDKNRNYRFVISHGNQVELYDNTFNKIKGFEFTKSESNILSSPQHILIGTKDYITIPETNGTLHILNRQGKTRTTVKTKFNFKNNLFRISKNNVTFIDEKNIVYAVNISSGKVNKLDILQGENTNKVNYSNEVKTKLEDNILTINNETIELEYGNYSTPKILKYNKKNYVNVTDLESKKVYLFNYKGKLLEQFPVYGQSPITLTNMDKDAKLEFAVKGEANSVLIYKMY